MQDLLGSLEPKVLFQYFLELSKIPRGSGAEAAAARWVADQGRALGAEVEQDAAGNVLIRAKGTSGREGRPIVALQAHIDMVCEKLADVSHDFGKDPIRVWRDGDLLRARGTTLGADNGVGVAAALAVLASKDVHRGPIEILITVDEERGLTGALALKPGWLRARSLLNLDSEQEGELTIGCAGGVDTTVQRKVEWVEPRPGRSALCLRVHGLKGGHSGIDIDHGRANAIRILAHAVERIAGKVDLDLSSVGGGTKRNAIPREAWALVFVEPRHESELRAEVARLTSEWRVSFGATEPALAIDLEPANAERVMAPADARAVIGALLAAPHGIETMSPDIAGLVQTSTNLARLDTRDGVVEISFLTRSSVEPAKHALAARIGATCALAGFSAEHAGSYPGWKPEPGSALVKLVSGVHQDLFGKPMVVRAIHAGLECGIIGEKYPTMEMVSFGPTMHDVHTPDERLSISAAGGFWKLLVGVLERV